MSKILPKGFVFVDQFFKPKLYQLQRFAIQKLQKESSSQLIQFQTFQQAEEFFEKYGKLPKGEKSLKSVMISMKDNIVNLQTNINENTEKQDPQLKLDKTDYKDILEEITQQLRKYKISKTKLDQIQILDTQYKELLYYYPKNIGDIDINNDKHFSLYFDGSSKNNPGQSGVGIALYENLKLIKEISQSTGIQTNNQAEFTALLFGIRYAVSLGIEQLTCYGDSQLVIEGMNEYYTIKNQRLLEIMVATRKYSKLFTNIQFQHIGREQNKIADNLSKKASSNN